MIQRLLPWVGVAGLALAPLALPPGSVAQSEVIDYMTARRRAVNFARIRAEAINGGLTVYRTAACMHERYGGSCLVSSSPDGYLFRFLGGPPGWERLGFAPTTETEILIAPDGRSLVELIYNGVPRGNEATAEPGGDPVDAAAPQQQSAPAPPDF
jgi:hypothetical protein